jgi:hypothetical protein
MADLENIRRLLAEALERADVTVMRVRREEESSGGGLCMVKGKRYVYLDAGNPVSRDVHLLTEALAHVSDNNMFLAPAVREWMESHQS